MLGLKTVGKAGRAYNDFIWPLKPGAIVEAPDWDPAPECGNGLHFLPWGEGDGYLLDCTPNARALIIEPLGEIVYLKGKAKTRRCRVVQVFETIPDAATYIAENGGAGKAIVGLTVTAGRYGIAVAGDFGTATVEDYGIAAAGGIGTATAGLYGIATAGVSGTAIAGNYGVATATGACGTAIAGVNGTAIAEVGGTAAAGDNGRICISYWADRRLRIAIGYIDETPDSEGHLLRAGVAYRLNNDAEFIPAVKRE